MVDDPIDSVNNKSKNKEENVEVDSLFLSVSILLSTNGF